LRKRDDVVRVQCAFIDTQEVEKNHHVVDKSVYHSIIAYWFVGEKKVANLDMDIS